MDFIFQQFWIALIFAMVANGAVWWVRGASTRSEYPSRTSSYRRLILWFVVAGSVPWVVMGAGINFAGIGDVFYFLNLRNADAWVWAFLGSGAALMLGLSIYVFVFDGADELAAHPGLLNFPENYQTRTMCRVFVPLLLAGQIAGFSMLWFYSDIFTIQPN